ncbi:MAG: DUF5916 domain-containing protein, partial [Bacteroidales bacterium]
FDNNYSANVSGTEFNIKNKQQSYSLEGVGLISQKYRKGHKPELGYNYELELEKETGNFIFELKHQTISDKYDPNDMGYLSRNNYTKSNLEFGHRTLNPVWIFLNWRNIINMNYQRLYKPQRFSDLSINLNSRGTLKNHMSLGFSGHIQPQVQRDYYEARVEHAVFNRPAKWKAGFWISSDYRKQLALDGGGDYGQTPQWNKQEYMLRLQPRFRVNDKIFITLKGQVEKNINDHGFTTYIPPDVIFGRRNTQTTTSTLTFRYIFNVKHGLNLRARHYHAKVNYQEYFTLQPDGSLKTKKITEDYNINFNAFNIDLSYNWRFAPGSEMSVVWKNELLEQGGKTDISYYQSLEQVFRINQFNSISIKILYYLDYNTIKTRLSQV